MRSVPLKRKITGLPKQKKKKVAREAMENPFESNSSENKSWSDILIGAAIAFVMALLLYNFRLPNRLLKGTSFAAENSDNLSIKGHLLVAGIFFVSVFAIRFFII